jgi:hypothetical protein
LTFTCTNNGEEGKGLRECRRVKCPSGNRLKGINGFTVEGVWQNANLVFIFVADVFYVVLHIVS